MIRRLRLASGLVIFSYLLTHFINHSLGLISLEAMEAGRLLVTALWRNLPATLLLYSALLLHLSLAVWSVFQRRSFKMPPWEAAQLLLGVLVPPLIVLHLLGTRFAHEVLGLDDHYAYILLIFFKFNYVSGIRQGLALIIAWTHGCLGLHYWLRFRPHYPAWQPTLFAIAILIPTLALAGTVAGGREVLWLAEQPGWTDQVMAAGRVPGAEDVAVVYRTEEALLLGYVALILLVLLARGLRIGAKRRRGLVTVYYPDNRRASVVAGTTVLEASRQGGIPHASVCGGRGRCSTCRVRVGQGADALPPPSDEEQRVLTRIGAPPNVRLACQTRPQADISVVPLLPSTILPGQATRRNLHQGREREMVILFADLRDFTSLAENKLPYDVVFVLNRYFAAMGTAVEESGGLVDKFIGDGVMALFGLQSDVVQSSRASLRAARRMAERLMEINQSLSQDLDRPLRVGIGIHSGPVIVGEMGFGNASALTAIGDAVNTASRLEALTKELGVQLVISENVARQAGLELANYPEREIELRGRAGRLSVRLVKSALSLPVVSGSGPEAR